MNVMKNSFKNFKKSMMLLIPETTILSIYGTIYNGFSFNEQIITNFLDEKSIQLKGKRYYTLDDVIAFAENICDICDNDVFESQKQLFFVKARQETVTKILEKLFDLYDSYDSFAKNSPYDESMYYDEDMSCCEAPF
jgi:hypothetical protein